MLLRGSFCKTSTGRRGDRSTAQRVTFTFTILYMIADDARLKPPRCKNHTAYDDTRLTSHRCKKHTAPFARSTGKFPSLLNTGNFNNLFNIMIKNSKILHSLIILARQHIYFRISQLTQCSKSISMKTSTWNQVYSESSTLDLLVIMSSGQIHNNFISFYACRQFRGKRV